MSVSEDKVPGEEVGRLKAKDPDLGDNGLVNYRLIDGDGMAMFELSTDSETKEAVIKVKKVRRTCIFQPAIKPLLLVKISCDQNCFHDSILTVSSNSSHSLYDL